MNSKNRGASVTVSATSGIAGRRVSAAVGAGADAAVRPAGMSATVSTVTTLNELSNVVSAMTAAGRSARVHLNRGAIPPERIESIVTAFRKKGSLTSAVLTVRGNTPAR
jgi:hypothetical protein